MREVPYLHIAFSTSKERNGTALIRDTLAALSPGKFLPVSSYWKFVSLVVLKRGQLKCVFALSDIHYLFALAVAGLFRLRLRIVLGYYHPEQWVVTLDEQCSKTRAAAMRRAIANISRKNIFFSSNAGFKSAVPRLKGDESGIIIPGPVFQEPCEKKKLPTTEFSVATIGRLVPFKACTVMAMIGVIEGLRDRNIRIRYSIYGDGPSKGDILARIESSPHKEAFTLYPPTEDSKFGEAVVGHHAFFGMGGAVIRAAMLGVPSIIAIQRESRPICYGLFSQYDHAVLPMFGDLEDGIVATGILQLMENLSTSDARNLQRIGELCKGAAAIYNPDRTMKEIESALENSDVNTSSPVSILDIILIRLETWLSRIRGIHTLDA